MPDNDSTDNDSTPHPLIRQLEVIGNAAWRQKAFFKNWIFIIRSDEGEETRMDASANLWTDTKEDTVSAVFRRKITGHRLHRAFGNVRFYFLRYSDRKAPADRLQGRIVRRGAYYARPFFKFPTVSRFYLWMMNATIDRERRFCVNNITNSK